MDALSSNVQSVKKEEVMSSHPCPVTKQSEGVPPVQVMNLLDKTWVEENGKAH